MAETSRRSGPPEGHGSVDHRVVVTSALVVAPQPRIRGPQIISRSRWAEWSADPIVNPNYRPWAPSDFSARDEPLRGLGRPPSPRPHSFLDYCSREERDKRRPGGLRGAGPRLVQLRAPGRWALSRLGGANARSQRVFEHWELDLRLHTPGGRARSRFISGPCGSTAHDAGGFGPSASGADRGDRP